MESINSAHKVLEILLTKAAISSKPSASTVRIPYKDLLASIGQKTDKQIDLLVTISLEWDAAEYDQSLSLDEYMELVEEEENE